MYFHPKSNIQVKLHALKFLLFLWMCFENTAVIARTEVTSSDTSGQRMAVLAAQYCQENKLEMAKEEIDLAILSDKENKEAYTWYIRGFIYKEIYKQSENTDPASPARDEAVQSFLQAKSLASDDQENVNTNTALNYLAATFFRDAISKADVIVDPHDESANRLFEAYRNLCLSISGEDLTTDKYIEFLHAKSKRLIALLSDDRCNEVLFVSVRQDLSEILELHPSDWVANYNLATVYYNTAIFSKKDEPDSYCYDKPERDAFLASALELLLNMEREVPNDVNLYRALMNVYAVSGNTEAAKVYEQKLQAGISNSKN